MAGFYSKGWLLVLTLFVLFGLTCIAVNKYQWHKEDPITITPVIMANDDDVCKVFRDSHGKDRSMYEDRIKSILWNQKTNTFFREADVLSLLGRPDKQEQDGVESRMDYFVSRRDGEERYMHLVFSNGQLRSIGTGWSIK